MVPVGGMPLCMLCAISHSGFLRLGRTTMAAKIALVTGAGTGVGKAVAIALAKAGYNLVLAGRRKDMLDGTAAVVNAAGQQARAVPTDVSKRDSIIALFDKVKSSFG